MVETREKKNIHKKFITTVVKGPPKRKNQGCEVMQIKKEVYVRLSTSKTAPTSITVRSEKMARGEYLYTEFFMIQKAPNRSCSEMQCHHKRAS